MPQALRTTLLSLRDLLVTAGPFLLLAAAMLAVAYWILDPTPKKHIVLATGVENGAYAEFGRRYAAFLAQHGVTVELRTTQGSAENLSLLKDPASGVDVAFVQGGSEGPPDGEEPQAATDLVSLGSLFYEPVWLFYRRDSARRLLKAPRPPEGGRPPRGSSEVAKPHSLEKTDALTSLAQLSGWKLNVGAPGSGVSPLMAQLLEANSVDTTSIELSRQPLTPAVVEFLGGRLDALAMASAPESLIVQMLLQTPGVQLADFAQNEAYSRRFPFMSAVTLPRGVVDLAKDVPSQDVHLVAPVASLVAREKLHPALVQLLVQAARRVHAGSGWFQRKNEFPNPRTSEWPLAPEAERVYRDGAPWLQRYLPFWAANLVDRMWVVLLSIVTLLIPLSRIVPPLYELRIRSRVFRWYGQLRAVEDATDTRPAGELLAELDTIEAKVGQISLPLSYADELYALRSHIQLVRRRLQGR
jgi:TRAP-type uncharacterized transport system substrate-binding protein